MKKITSQAGVSYYKKKLGGEVLFLVFSDDMQWCRENLQHPSVVFAGDRYTLETRNLFDFLLTKLLTI